MKEIRDWWDIHSGIESTHELSEKVKLMLLREICYQLRDLNNNFKELKNE